MNDETQQSAHSLEKPVVKSKENESGDEDGEEDYDDEIPPVVVRKAVSGRKKKGTKLTQLDVNSEDDDDNNSDEDFKGTSSSEEAEEESGSEESAYGGRNRRNASGPVRRSTRARATRFDADFSKF